MMAVLEAIAVINLILTFILTVRDVARCAKNTVTEHMSDVKHTLSEIRDIMKTSLPLQENQSDLNQGYTASAPRI